MKPRKVGQPPRAGVRSTAYLQIRITPAEKRSIAERAKEAGLSISDWVRARLIS